MKKKEPYFTYLGFGFIRWPCLNNARELSHANALHQTLTLRGTKMTLLVLLIASVLL